MRVMDGQRSHDDKIHQKHEKDLQQQKIIGIH
jgi:hypothetical protein